MWREFMAPHGMGNWSQSFLMVFLQHLQNPKFQSVLKCNYKTHVLSKKSLLVKFLQGRDLGSLGL